MKLLTNRQNDKIGDRLCAELRKAKSIFIAAAYFLPSDAVLNLMSKVPDLKIIVSEEFNINNPDKLKPLTNRGRVRCIPTSPAYTHGWGRMSIMDTKPFMLPPAWHSISGHKLQVIRIPV